MAKDKKFSHEEGVSFLTALIALIYNFIKSFKRTNASAQ